MSSGTSALDERSRRVAESLSVGNPGNNARSLPPQASPRAECQIELGIEEIRPYEHNPRRTRNAKFDDIKESIRAGGLRSPITVTQRPGETHYIVEAGGNTRLLALRQLWAETKDPRFRRLVVLFRPWRTETQVLTAHLIENEQRGDMSFWDRATGIVALKTRLEAEQGRALTLRPLEDALHGLGLAVNTATLALYLYATERLRALGEVVPDLAGLDVKTLQPRLNALRRYAHARAGISEDALYGEVFEPVFRTMAGSFSVKATVEGCEVALARRLGEPVEVLRQAMSSGAARPERDLPREEGEQRSACTLGPVADGPAAAIADFARKAGIDAEIARDPAAVLGCRLLPLPESQKADAVRRRAWSALAFLIEPDRKPPPSDPPLPPPPEFIRWLADPEDETAAAFLALLAALRRSRSVPAGEAT
ncbi:MAG: ParB N-terminal domain-containing protein [Burkholderiaceae bacterium]